MRMNAGENEGASRMNREMNYRYRSDGVGYMCCETSKGNVHKKVINVVDSRGMGTGAEESHTRAKVGQDNDMYASRPITHSPGYVSPDQRIGHRCLAQRL